MAGVPVVAGVVRAWAGSDVCGSGGSGAAIGRGHSGNHTGMEDGLFPGACVTDPQEHRLARAVRISLRAHFRHPAIVRVVLPGSKGPKFTHTQGSDSFLPRLYKNFQGVWLAGLSWVQIG